MPETTPRQRLWRRASAGAALLVPGVYPALLAVLAIAVASLLLRPLFGDRGLGLVVFSDVLPALLLGIVLFWLLRPALTRRTAAAGVMVAPEQMPPLQAMIASLAVQVQVPEPADVIVDMVPRVRARWHVPLLSPRSAELRLYIGAPVVAALDSRQVAGMIADALAAAAPANAPVTLQLLQDGIAWLNRLAEQQSGVDRRVQRAIARGQGVERSLALVAERVLRTPHRLLGVLARFAAIVANPMLRRRALRTFDCQRQIAGGEAVADALRRCIYLKYAVADLERELRAVDGRELLCSDVAGLAVWMAEQRAAAQSEDAVLDDADELIDGLSVADRLEAAPTVDEPLVARPVAAVELIPGYVEVARQLSVEYYLELGLTVDPQTLAPVTRARAALSVRKQRDDALSHYFRNALVPGHAVPTIGFDEALRLDPAVRVERLRAAVAEVRQAVPELLEMSRQYPAAAEAVLAAEAAVAVARYRPDADAEPALQRAREVYAKQASLRSRYDALFGHRLGIGLAEAVHRGGDQKRMLAKVRPTIEALSALASLEPDLATCRREITIAMRLATTRGAGVSIPASSYLTQMSNVVKRIERLHQRLDAVRIEQGAIADRLRSVLPPLPEDADAQALQQHLAALDLALERIRRRVLGRLVVLAGSAEAARGIRVKLVE